MACPLFDPTRPCAVQHADERPRPPLGCYWNGVCHGCEPADKAPAELLLTACNIGYGRTECERARGAAADAVRFSVLSADGGSVEVRWLIERDCLPLKTGTALYDVEAGCWRGFEAEPLLSRQATAYVSVYLGAVGSEGG